MTGAGMAQAAKEFIEAGQITPTGYPTEAREKSANDTAEIFLHGHLRFVSPQFVADKATDPRLNKLFDVRCLDQLTHTAQNQPAADSTGPFFVYRFRAREKEYLAVAVFGRADLKMVTGKSYGQRVREESSAGVIWFLDRWPECHFLTGVHLGTRSAKTGNPPFKPRLAGFAYNDGKVFIYRLTPVSGGEDTTGYLIELTVTRLRDGKFVRQSEAFVTDFPADFDPIAIIDKQQRLP